MVERVGSIEYSVDADVKGLVSAENSVDKSSKKMAGSLNQADKAAGMLDVRMTKTAKSVKAANQSMGNLSRKAGQAGIQIQQLVGQVQAGTSPFVALSQQGADLGIVLGAPLVGAIVGIGAVIAGNLIPSLFESTDATKELELALERLDKIVTTTDDGVLVLTNEIAELAKVSREAAEVQISFGLIQAAAAIEKAGEQIRDSFAETSESFFGPGISRAIAQYEILTDRGDQLTESTLKYGAAASRTGKDFGALRSILGELSSELGINRQESIAIFEAFAEADINGTAESFKNLEATLANVTSNYIGSNQTLVEFTANMREQFKTITTASERQELLQRALSNTEEFLKRQSLATSESQKSFEKYIASLQAQADTLGFTDRARANYIASLNDASGAEIAQINLIFDKIEAYKQEAEALKRLQDEQDAAAKAAVESQKQQTQALGQLSSSFSQLSSTVGSTLGEDFARFQNFASAISQVAALTAAVQALADPTALTPVQKFAQYGTVLAAGLSAGASIGAVAYSGRQMGGPVSAGTPYRVGEAGPEIFTDGSRNFLIPGQNGQVIPNQEIGAGDGSGLTVNFNVVNNSSGAEFVAQGAQQNGTTLTVEGLVRDLSTGNGEVSGALNNAYNIERRTR